LTTDSKLEILKVRDSLSVEGSGSHQPSRARLRGAEAATQLSGGESRAQTALGYQEHTSYKKMTLSLRESLTENL